MLIRLMLRTALVAALKGKTSVGERVFDSSLTTLSIGPTGQVVTDQRDGAFIAIYTGEGSFQPIAGHPSGSLLGSGMTDVLVQYGITQKMVTTDAQTDESELIGFGYPAMDEALQMSLDVIGREIANELMTPTSAWGEVARDLAPKLTDARVLPGASNDEGIRLAVHQMSFSAHLLNEPMRLEPGTPFETYLSLLDASTVQMHGEQAALLRALLGGSLDEAEIARRRLGQTIETWLEVGLGELDDEAGILETATIDTDGRAPVEVS